MNRFPQFPVAPTKFVRVFYKHFFFFFMYVLTTNMLWNILQHSFDIIFGEINIHFVQPLFTNYIQTISARLKMYYCKILIYKTTYIFYVLCFWLQYWTFLRYFFFFFVTGFVPNTFPSVRASPFFPPFLDRGVHYSDQNF